MSRTTLSIMYAYLGDAMSVRSRSVKRARARDVVQELRERLDSVASEVVELVDENLGRLVGDGGRGEGKRFVGEEVAIVSRTQLCAEVWVEINQSPSQH